MKTPGREDLYLRKLAQAPVMAGVQLWLAAYHGRVDDVRRLLDQGVPPDEYREVSAAPAAAGGACADALCWGAALASRAGGRR